MQKLVCDVRSDVAIDSRNKDKSTGWKSVVRHLLYELPMCCNRCAFSRTGNSVIIVFGKENSSTYSWSRHRFIQTAGVASILQHEEIVNKEEVSDLP